MNDICCDYDSRNSLHQIFSHLLPPHPLPAQPSRFGIWKSITHTEPVFSSAPRDGELQRGVWLPCAAALEGPVCDVPHQTQPSDHLSGWAQQHSVPHTCSGVGVPSPGHSVLAHCWRCILSEIDNQFSRTHLSGQMAGSRPFSKDGLHCKFYLGSKKMERARQGPLKINTYFITLFQLQGANVEVSYNEGKKGKKQERRLGEGK